VSKSTKMKKIFIFLPILAIGFWWFYVPSLTSLPDSQFNSSLIRKQIGNSIRITGAAKTYDQVKNRLSTVDNARQHSVAHIFGELLYTIEGLEGISVCDSSFGFGCYHSFFGRAISEKGESIVKELDKVCVDSYGPMGLGCPHGIGHGLGEYFGPEKIDRQLEICDSLTWKGRFLGCKGGVFMEYYTPIVTENDTVTTTVRPYEQANPYGVCPRVEPKFQPACFLELTGWWERVLEKDYTNIGKLCDSITDPINRESCLLGVGYAAVQSNGYDIEQSMDICKTMPDDDSIMLCRAGASWSFFANPQFRDQSKKVCEGSVLCEQKSDLLAY